MDIYEADDKLTNLLNNECHVRRYHIDDSGDEIRRFDKARKTVRAELDEQFNKYAANADDLVAEEYSLELESIDDEKFINNVYDMISDQMVNAEFAVAQVADIFAQYSEPTDEQLGMRGTAEHIIRVLLGIE